MIIAVPKIYKSRADDNEATVRNRLVVYNEDTQPLINYYSKQDKLKTVAGAGELEDIQQSLVAVIEAEINPI